MSCVGLAERRERKRAKRAITRPPRTTVHEEERSPANQDKAKQKSKGKKQTLLGGLALLHGFTATNIGKNRLTVSAGVNLAFFPCSLTSVCCVVESPRQSWCVQQRESLCKIASEQTEVFSNCRYVDVIKSV
jgi:hypothetical protein